MSHRLHGCKGTVTIILPRISIPVMLGIYKFQIFSSGGSEEVSEEEGGMEVERTLPSLECNSGRHMVTKQPSTVSGLDITKNQCSYRKAQLRNTQQLESPGFEGFC